MTAQTDELFIKSILGIYECKRQRGLSVEEATSETVQTVQRMQRQQMMKDLNKQAAETARERKLNDLQKERFLRALRKETERQLQSKETPNVDL